MSGEGMAGRGEWEENLAREWAPRMAVAVNGGDWERDYTEAQKDGWFRKALWAVREAWRLRPEDEMPEEGRVLVDPLDWWAEGWLMAETGNWIGDDGESRSYFVEGIGYVRVNGWVLMPPGKMRGEG